MTDILNRQRVYATWLDCGMKFSTRTYLLLFVLLTGEFLLACRRHVDGLPVGGRWANVKGSDGGSVCRPQASFGYQFLPNMFNNNKSYFSCYWIWKNVNYSVAILQLLVDYSVMLLIAFWSRLTSVLKFQWLTSINCQTSLKNQLFSTIEPY